jgi:hypothetical protein
MAINKQKSAKDLISIIEKITANSAGLDTIREEMANPLAELIEELAIASGSIDGRIIVDTAGTYENYADLGVPEGGVVTEVSHETSVFNALDIRLTPEVATSSIGNDTMKYSFKKADDDNAVTLDSFTAVFRVTFPDASTEDVTFVYAGVGDEEAVLVKDISGFSDVSFDLQPELLSLEAVLAGETLGFNSPLGELFFATVSFQAPDMGASDARIIVDSTQALERTFSVTNPSYNPSDGDLIIPNNYVVAAGDRLFVSYWVRNGS